MDGGKVDNMGVDGSVLENTGILDSMGDTGNDS